MKGRGRGENRKVDLRKICMRLEEVKEQEQLRMINWGEKRKLEEDRKRNIRERKFGRRI